MVISRRGFLQAGTVAGLAVIIPEGLNCVAFGQTSSKDLRSGKLAKLTMKKFEGQLDTVFRFKVKNAGWVDLQLVSVTDLRSESAKKDQADGKECFTLLFRGPKDVPLGQGTYYLKHEDFGKFYLFIVPADAENNVGPKYEAIINRLDK